MGVLTVLLGAIAGSRPALEVLVTATAVVFLVGAGNLFQQFVVAEIADHAPQGWGCLDRGDGGRFGGSAGCRRPMRTTCGR